LRALGDRTMNRSVARITGSPLGSNRMIQETRLKTAYLLNKTLDNDHIYPYI